MLKLIVASMLLVASCASAVKCMPAEGLSGVTYCMGKVSGDGQEGVFRDVWQENKPVLSSFGGGASLWGQALQGVAGDAALAGGMVGAAALLRPARSREVNHLDNQQIQGQGQEQSSTAVNINSNVNKVKMSDIGGGSGGDGGSHPGCLKSKHC